MDNFFSKAYADTLYVGAGYVDDEINALAIQIAAAYQPLDADLTALAALSGTNTIYYRSGANTWSAVTIGSNLTFSGGTLAATGGGGGDALTTNPLSQFSATTSAQLAGVISDETGSGALVFATSPTLVTPLLGTPASGTLTNCTGYPYANLSGTPSTFTPASHTHGNITNAGAIGSTTDLPVVTTTSGVLTVGAFTGTGNVVRSASPTFTGTAIFAVAQVGGRTINVGDLFQVGASGGAGWVYVNSSGTLVSVVPNNSADYGGYAVISSGDSFGRMSFGLNNGTPFFGAGPGSGARDTFFSRASSGVWNVGTSSSNSSGSVNLANLTASALICAGTYTVGTLPTASSNAYKFATVSDSSVTAFGSTVAGGGSSKVMVFSNGTNWTVCAA